MNLRKGTMLVILYLCVFLTGCYAAAAKDGVEEILTLLHAGVGEDVIRAHIDQQGFVFDLSTGDIIKLKKAGASDGLLAYMIKSETGEFPFDIDDEYVVKQPVKYRHLAIFPVFRKKTVDVGDHITLDEAQKANVITISELSNADVPTVVIRNRGRRPLYIMAGEIIIGGKQDRMVSFDVLIPAGKEMHVEVKCVEHGRWHGVSEEFSSGAGLGTKDVRSALQFEAQQDVWDEVSALCKKNEISTGSGTYGAVLSSREIEERSRPFIDAVARGLKDESAVGMIMALNGEVVCVDIFANPAFFTKVKDKLLKAYVLDAISTEEASNASPGKSEIKAFFEELKAAAKKASKGYDDNANLEMETDKIIGNESRDADGKVQHLNVYKHK